MINIAFFIILTLYFFIAKKVYEFQTLYTLGFKLDVPQGFLKHPSLYNFVSIIFFFATIFFWFLNDIPFSFILVLCAWYFSGSLGREKAFNKKRQILKEDLESRESDDEMRELLVKEIEKTNKDYREDLEKKMGL